MAGRASGDLGSVPQLRPPRRWHPLGAQTNSVTMAATSGNPPSGSPGAGTAAAIPGCSGDAGAPAASSAGKAQLAVATTVTEPKPQHGRKRRLHTSRWKTCKGTVRRDSVLCPARVWCATQSGLPDSCFLQRSFLRPLGPQGCSGTSCACAGHAYQHMASPVGSSSRRGMSITLKGRGKMSGENDTGAETSRRHER
eukprot:scaffold921_cov397-Prasinococcus_capsulatus_cf.AAC.21